jgi:hypothetical protein
VRLRTRTEGHALGDSSVSRRWDSDIRVP